MSILPILLLLENPCSKCQTKKYPQKFLNFHAAEVKATVLWDEKKCVAFDTRKQEKKKKLRVHKD